MPYEINSPYEGAYNVIDTDDGERVYRVDLFMPGPMVLAEGPSITSPSLARVVAEAMTLCASHIDGEATTVADSTPELCWHVGVTETCTRLARFASHDAAAEHIGTLPDAESGIYYIDGPER
jgi:hypothetical protein